MLKADVICREIDPKGFPKLMTDGVVLILMHKVSQGTVIGYLPYKSEEIHYGPDQNIDSYSDRWPMNNLSDFNGTVTLSNE